jgi:membrane-associated phospholipid phosphatase
MFARAPASLWLPSNSDRGEGPRDEKQGETLTNELTDSASKTPAGPGGLLSQAEELKGEVFALDRAVFDAVAAAPTPLLDDAMAWVSNAANNSKIWVGVATALAASGGRGRSAAVRGLLAIGISSISINAVVKGLFPRQRPDRSSTGKGADVRMPTSSSFPSGHAASAFAFATAASAELPQVSLPLYGLATVVGYSRVHTGVHYPSDVLTGAVLGSAIATAVPVIIARRPKFLRRQGSQVRGS